MNVSLALLTVVFDRKNCLCSVYRLPIEYLMAINNLQIRIAYCNLFIIFKMQTAKHLTVNVTGSEDSLTGYVFSS